MPAPHTTQKASPFLTLPPELRLQIYSYLLDIPNPYITRTSNPLIVINDTGNKFTTRPAYRALHISPKWEVGLGDCDSSNRNSSSSSNSNKNKGPGTGTEALALLSVNRQIHAELEDFLYTDHTLFFLNGFDLDYLGEFLDTLSPTARKCIRSIGFEVYLFVHGGYDAEEGAPVPKRSWASYERAAEAMSEKLPNLERVVFYLDPWFSACSSDAVFGPWNDEGKVLARAVRFLVRVFGGLKVGIKLDFLPTAAMYYVGAGFHALGPRDG
ncbi:hypothetical protein BJX61DRAFT_532545 [Aspergillus egyptiacus]|nr:hypothetical protein BJX61DRAFT_532545 [Aspergillus egyptiacus]